MNDLEKRRAALIAYARSCLDSGDWHGLRDACTDLEVIEARLEERATEAAKTTNDKVLDAIQNLHESELALQRARLAEVAEQYMSKRRRPSGSKRR